MVNVHCINPDAYMYNESYRPRTILWHCWRSVGRANSQPPTSFAFGWVAPEIVRFQFRMRIGFGSGSTLFQCQAHWPPCIPLVPVRRTKKLLEVLLLDIIKTRTSTSPVRFGVSVRGTQPPPQRSMSPACLNRLHVVEFSLHQSHWVTMSSSQVV